MSHGRSRDVVGEVGEAHYSTGVNKDKSTVTLDLPATNKRHPVFHTSQVFPFIENDASLFPSREFSKPPPITDEFSNKEFLV